MNEKELASQLFGGGQMPGASEKVSEKFMAEQPDMKDARMEGSIGMEKLISGVFGAENQGMSGQGMEPMKRGLSM